jgi:hypothetical protein
MSSRRKTEDGTMSVLEQLKELDDKRAQLLDGAKTAALEKANEAIEELNELGFKYSLSDGAQAPRARSPKAKAEGDAPKDVACPICKVKTSPLHDSRSHRSQNPKKAFTAEELEAKHLKIVE